MDSDGKIVLSVFGMVLVFFLFIVVSILATTSIKQKHCRKLVEMQAPESVIYDICTGDNK